MRKVLSLVFFAFTTCPSFAQYNVLTLGFQFKPIFSNKFFKTGPQSSDSMGVNFTVKPNSGYCIGAVIRYGISNNVSFESGINYVKRNYTLTISDGSFTDNSYYRIVGYEIPLAALVFIPLSEKIFMDASLGGSFDFFPTDVYTEDDYFKHISKRSSWVFGSVLANLGWEYRTEKSGYFYLGASLHRPFSAIYTSTIVYYKDPNAIKNPAQQFLLSGNYLTFDLRYYFHEEPLKKQNKKKKNLE